MNVQPIAGGTCPKCGFVVVIEEDNAGRKTKTVKCPECTTCLDLRWVYGEHSDIPCDARCMGATSDKCGCSCGGRNHRRSYLDIQLVPALRIRDKANHEAKVRRREAKKRAERLTKAEQVAEQREAYPALAQLAAYTGDLGFGFLWDMQCKVTGGQLLTPAQAESTSRAFTQMLETKARREREQADREAQQLALRESGVRCPTGRKTVTGEIVMARIKDEGHYGWTYSAMVRTDEGWTFWTTIPKACIQANPASNYRAKRYDYNAGGWTDLPAHERSFKGLRIEVTATFTPDDRDPLRGRAQRPSGKLLTLPEAAAPAA